MSIVLISCEDKGLMDTEWLQEPNFSVPITLTSSSEDVVLSDGNDNAIAITFTWTKGNDRGAGTTLTYFIRMDVQGNNFGDDTVLSEEIPSGVFTKSYSVKELNDLLREKWDYPGDTKVKLEAEIIARVNNSPQFQKPELAFTSFFATTYNLPPLPLFLVGDAISGGWDYSIGKRITEVIERAEYIYTGNFSVGSFKIIEKSGNELPSYDPKNATNIVYNETEQRTKDNVFKVPNAGRYSLFLNRVGMTYVFAYTPYEKVYMVGTSTIVGWDIGNAIPMIWDAKKPQEFTYTGPLVPGRLRLPLNPALGWGSSFLHPLVNSTEINGDGTDIKTLAFSQYGDPDFQWEIKTAGNYKITVNQSEMTVVFIKL